MSPHSTVRHRQTPALARATAYLRTRASSAATGSGEKLPSIRTLASLAGVSFVTMWKAVHALGPENGLLVSRAGTYIGAAEQALRAHAHDSPPHAPACRPPHWLSVRDALAQSILAGDFSAAERFPSIKTLSAAHDAAPATISAALRALNDSGVIERAGRGYRLAHGPRRHSTAAVVFVSKSSSMDWMTDLSQRSQELWRALESRCARRDIRLRIEPFETFDTSHRSKDQSNIAGYIVRNPDMPLADTRTLLSNIARRGRPVAVVDELGDGVVRAALPHRRTCRLFSIANSTRAGLDMGRHLLAAGVRRPVFISPYDTAAWSTNRCEGFIEAFSSALPSGAVRTHAPTGLADDFALRECALRSKRVSGLCTALARFEKAGGTVEPVTMDTFSRDPFFDYVLRHTLDQYLRPIFDTLASERADCWVCVNDMTALSALRYLNGNHRQPHPLVVGFDDCAEAVTHGLTSYNFNVGALAEALLAHVLGAPQIVAAGARIVEIPGFVIART